MSKDDSNRRRYSEEEFALILRKASEIQESPKGGGGKAITKGLTLEEIQSIASEAGMDAHSIFRAAALIDSVEWQEKSGLAAKIFGGPGKYHMNFEVPGRLPPDEVHRLLEVIRGTVETQGKTEEVLGGVQWSTIGEVSGINVNISPRGDSTSIQIVGDRSAAGALSFTFPMAASAVLVGALGAVFEPSSAVGIVSLVVGLLGTGFLTGRTLYHETGKAFHRKLSRLMETLSSAAETAALPPGSEDEGETDG